MPRFQKDLSPEEREADIARILNFAISRKAITDHTGGKRGVAGRVPCPVCKTGELRFSVAECNGHIHARCTTKDCMAWME